MVARVAYGVAVGSDMVTAEVIDWDAFRAYSSTLKVTAVPKTFINYTESFVGTETEAAILERIRGNGE